VAVVVRSVRIVNSLGLHARPAATFVRLAGRHPCQVFVKKDDLEVNGKSIMGMMMLAAEMGSELTIRADGEGAEHAVLDLVGLVQGGFGEV
jgi:phosphocarrier protein HPr